MEALAFLIIPFCGAGGYVLSIKAPRIHGFILSMFFDEDRIAKMRKVY